MRLLIQRVKKARVVLKDTGRVVGQIGEGLLVLVGVKKADTEGAARELARKLLALRVMSDKSGKMNLSVTETNSELLIISQFTLYGDTTGGRRPSFVISEEPTKAQKIYLKFVDLLSKGEVNVATGSFGKYMEIEAVLDGPVTLIMEK